MVICFFVVEGVSLWLYVGGRKGILLVSFNVLVSLIFLGDKFVWLFFCFDLIILFVSFVLNLLFDMCFLFEFVFLYVFVVFGWFFMLFGVDCLLDFVFFVGVGIGNGVFLCFFEFLVVCVMVIFFCFVCLLLLFLFIIMLNVFLEGFIGLGLGLDLSLGLGLGIFFGWLCFFLGVLWIGIDMVFFFFGVDILSGVWLLV